MGAFGAFIIGLFSLCFRKLKTKQETTTRIIILILVAVVLGIIAYVVGEGSIVLLGVYAFLFGWRLLADIVRCIANNFEPDEEENEDDEQDTTMTDENDSSQNNESEDE